MELSQLLPIELGLPLEWLPDETLYSLCSRYHRVSGNRLASTTCKTLFGHATQGCAHDFPARLDHFTAAAGPALGTVEEIVEHHTLLPLYLRFATTALSEKAVVASRETSAGQLKFQLGLLTSRFRANHPLKACPTCMAEDARDHATPYWHREHQLPGVWVCLRHGCWLQSSDLKATGVSRFQWILPSQRQFTGAHETIIPSSAVKLAQTVVSVMARHDLRFSHTTLSTTYRMALNAQGLLSGPKQRLKHEAAGASYATFIAPLAFVEQLEGLPRTAHAACIDISRQIGSERCGIHPLRRLALAAWLFEDLDDFLALSKGIGSRNVLGNTAIPPVSMRTPIPLQDVRKEHFCALLTSGLSISSAARAAGIDTTTGMAWAASIGIATPRRPKVLKLELRKQLVALLRKGVSKSKVAAQGDVSLQTVTTLIRTEVGLHEAWRQATFANAQRSNRRRWERFVEANPLSGVKAARLAEPSTYAWLYRNDPVWLAKKTDAMTRVARNPKARVDWDARDQHLADTVRHFALVLADEAPEQRIKLFQIYQRLPELKAKLFKLDRLPLTRSAIFGILRDSKPT